MIEAMSNIENTDHYMKRRTTGKDFEKPDTNARPTSTVLFLGWFNGQTIIFLAFGPK